MTTPPSLPAPTREDTQPIPKVRSGERRRAAIALGVLAVAAVILVLIMIAVLGRSKASNKAPIAQPTGPAVIHTGRSSAAPSGTTSSVPRPKPSRSAQPANGPVSCPTSAPCTVPADAGNFAAAVNAYRAQHGQRSVRVTVTAAAKTCALSQGNTCPNGFFWEPVGRSGAQVVQKIAAKGGSGVSFLLDPRLTRMQVGWAYLPAGKSFYCAVIVAG